MMFFARLSLFILLCAWGFGHQVFASPLRWGRVAYRLGNVLTRLGAHPVPQGHTFALAAGNYYFLRAPHVTKPLFARALHSVPLVYDEGEKAQNDSDIVIANPCIDGIFQHGLAPTEVALDFLNAMLGLEGDKKLKSIYVESRDLPKNPEDAEDSLSFTVDFRCTTQQGDQVFVELQNDFRPDYHKKLLTEHCLMFSALDTWRQADFHHRNVAFKKSRPWKHIKGVYSIVLTNAVLKRNKKFHQGQPWQEPQLRNTYCLQHSDDPTRYFGDVPFQLTIVALANLPENITENSSSVEKWGYLFRDASMARGTNRLPRTKVIDRKIITENDKGVWQFVERVREEQVDAHIKRLREKRRRDREEGLALMKEALTEQLTGELTEQLIKKLIKKGKLSEEDARDIRISD